MKFKFFLPLFFTLSAHGMGELDLNPSNLKSVLLHNLNMSDHTADADGVIALMALTDHVEKSLDIISFSPSNKYKTECFNNGKSLLYFISRNINNNIIDYRKSYINYLGLLEKVYRLAQNQIDQQDLALTKAKLLKIILDKTPGTYDEKDPNQLVRHEIYQLLDNQPQQTQICYLAKASLIAKHMYRPTGNRLSDLLLANQYLQKFEVLGTDPSSSVLSQKEMFDRESPEELAADIAEYIRVQYSAIDNAAPASPMSNIRVKQENIEEGNAIDNELDKEDDIAAPRTPTSKRMDESESDDNDDYDEKDEEEIQ